MTLDSIDRQILEMLQHNCKLPLALVGKQVGLSAPAVVDRIRKLEDAQVIRGYVALIDAKQLGKDVTAFIGISSNYPKFIDSFEAAITDFEDVLECHHVTGDHTFVLKIKTYSTTSLEGLIRRLRSLEGVTRTQTMVVLSTSIERTRLATSSPEESPELRATPRKPRRRREARNEPA